MSPRITFEKELKILHEKVADMAQKVEENYEKLFEAYENKEKEIIRNILQNDKEINNKQREIESACMFLITKQQPVIGDLRTITASLKVVTDIERVGDHVADVAELLLRLKMKNMEQYSMHLVPMIQATKEMLHLAAVAFVEHDVKRAREVIKSDDIVDTLFNKVKNDLINLLRKGAKDVDECIDILMIAKYLEKIGDHAVNIGEWAMFQETGDVNNIRIL